MDISRSESSWCGLLGAVDGVMVGPGSAGMGRRIGHGWHCWVLVPEKQSQDRHVDWFGFDLGFGSG